jgi:SAM-dependent methyltransferase
MSESAPPYEIPDLPTRETERYVRAHIPADAKRLLEVGCGNGVLAARLQQQGLQVTAVDISRDAVREAGMRGVRAVEADFLLYEDVPFDVVLFSRVLHHLDSLRAAVDRAADLLRPGGIVIAEEHAIERMDLETARWFYELVWLLEAAEIVRPPQLGGWMPERPLDRWYEQHLRHGPVHQGEDMLLALGQRFEVLLHAQVPYLYRYFWRQIVPTQRGATIAGWAFARETQRVLERSLRPIGLRIVGKKWR